MDTIILISISSLITLGVYFMFKISNKNRKNMINEIKDKVNE
jgi:Na+/melibiose symporter-like transporter